MQQLRRFTTEQCEWLREDLVQQMVAVKVESKEYAEAGEARLEELREEVAGLQCSLEKQLATPSALPQIVGMVEWPECPKHTEQGQYYAWLEPGDTGLCAVERGQPGVAVAIR